MKVLYFAAAREAVGVTEEDIGMNEVGEAANSVGKFREMLIKRHPELESVMKSCVFALNQEYILRDNEDTKSIKDGDVVAVIPPISGG